MPTPPFQPALVFNFAVILWDVQGPAFFGIGGPNQSRGERLAAGLVGGVLSALTQALFGGFAEVTGLNAELEVETYSEGGNNVAPLKFAKWGKYPNLVLKRGVTTRTDLWDWHAQILEGKNNLPMMRKSGLVILFDRGGPGSGNRDLQGLTRIPLAAWYVYRAFPERVQGPQLDAKGNSVAIETVELAHEGVSRVSLSQIPGLADVGAALGGLVGTAVGAGQAGLAAGLGTIQ